MEKTPQSPEVRPGRLLSLDLMRGYTVAFMIIVNNPGDWSHVYAPLLHAEWNGLTPTDLVFPSFLFMMGCAIPFSLGGKISRGVKKSRLFAESVRRSAVLLGLGWLLAILAVAPDWGHFRFYGVLPRFAATYFVCATLFLFVRSVRFYVLTILGIVFGYSALLHWIPVPGAGFPGHDFPVMDPDANIVSWLDRKIVLWTQTHFGTGLLYKGTRDPEGALSTIAACATVMSGIVSGFIMQQANRQTSKHLITRWTLGGAAALLLSAGLSVWVPLNKNMWTGSFVLFCAGIDILLLRLLWQSVDSRPDYAPGRIAKAFEEFGTAFGANALIAFIVSEALAIFLDERFQFHGVTAHQFLYSSLFSGIHPENIRSLLYALTYLFVCFIPNFILYRKKIVIRI
ncbi:MAG: DUF5009 domain-containing protein [Acetobacter persici]|uniref:acyltransferase family protein n=1 Tax=Acetobacter persici TaxID=1076596 RepID=UPI0039E7FAE2